MLIVISDLHVGSTMALWPPGMTDGDGADIALNSVQREIWTYWQEFINAADTEAKRIHESPSLLINGDLVQGAHPERDGQLVTDEVGLQAEAAVLALRGMLAILRGGKVFVTRGTPWHDGRSGNAAEGIAAKIGVLADARTGQHSKYHNHLWLGDKLVDAMHHISTARVFPINPLQKVVTEAYVNHAKWRVAIPDIFIRSHVHAYAHYDDGLGRNAFVTDPWQVPGEFAHKVVPGVLPIVGGIWLNVEHGIPTWQTFRRLVMAARPMPV